MNSTSERYDVFLSHNSADKSAVEAIGKRLQEEGLRPFLDKWHLVPGTPWQEDIVNVLDQSACTAIFLGPSGEGAWQHQEMQAALNKAVRTRDDYRVIPVLLPGAEPTRVNAFLQLRTWIDYRPGLDDAVAHRRLVSAIKGEAPDDSSYSLPDEPRPYRGLERFEGEQSEFFFGRDSYIRRLIERISEEGFVAVVGASGSGKSSLVRAGLWTDIAEAAKPGIRGWRRITLRPGADPLLQLAAQLVAHLPEPQRPSLIERLRNDFRHADDGLTTALATLFPNLDNPLLLVVDQFEELFTLRPTNRDEQKEWRERTGRFAANLRAAFRSCREWLRIVVTLRADFVDLFVGNDLPDCRELLERRQLWLGEMSQDELREAIVFPAKRRGAFFEKGVVELILRDMQGQSTALPLLEEALDAVWVKRRGPWLTMEAYLASGGVGGALAARAENLYGSLRDEERPLARRIFLSLIQLGEGTRDTRRRVPSANLWPAFSEESPISRIVHRLSSPQARLITLSSTPDGTETVEIIHEALIDHWDRLSRWLESSRDELRLQRRLEEAAIHWNALGQPAGGLWRPPDLDLLREFVRSSDAVLTPLQLAFYESSDCTDKATRAEEQLQHQRELDFAKTLAVTETQRAEEQKCAAARLRRRARQLTAVAVASGVLAIAAVALLVVARIAQQRAEQAETFRMLAQVDMLLNAEPDSVPVIVKNLAGAGEAVNRHLRDLDAKELPAFQRIRVALALLPVDESKLSFLQQELATADARELRMMCEGMSSHSSEVARRLWPRLEDPNAPLAERFRAACVLAAFEPNDRRWEAVLPTVADGLAEQPTLSLPAVLKALEPLHVQLREPLLTIFRKTQDPEKQTRISTALGEYYAGEENQLVGMLLNADKRVFTCLLPALERGRAKVIPALEAGASETLQLWHDPASSSWTQPDSRHAREIGTADGLFTPEFAFVQSLPLEQVQDLIETLRPTGYRPTRFRPYLAEEKVLCAAVLRRDGLEWRAATDLAKEQVRDVVEQWKMDDYAICDVAGYLKKGQDGGEVERYALISLKVDADTNQEVHAGYTFEELTATLAGRNQYTSPLNSLQVFSGSNGVPRYSAMLCGGIPFTNWQPCQSESTLQWQVSQGRVQLDICLFPRPTSNEAVNHWDLSAEMPRELGAAANDLVKPIAQGSKLYGEGHYSEAIAALDVGIEKYPFVPLGYAFRALAHARVGNLELARSDLAETQQRIAAMGSSYSSNVSVMAFHAYVFAVVSALLGEIEQAESELQRFVNQSQNMPNNADALFTAARAYAVVADLASAEAATRAPEQSAVPNGLGVQVGGAVTSAPVVVTAERCARQAIELITQAVNRGFTNLKGEIDTHPDLTSLRNSKEFSDARDRWRMDRYYCSVWGARPAEEAGLETSTLYGLCPSAHIDACRGLAERGYRPRTISVASVGRPSRPLAASVWERPIATVAALDSIAQRRNNATLALLQLGDDSHFLRALQVSPDPSQQTHLINLAQEMGVDADLLVDRLLKTEEDHGRYILVLTLGGYRWDRVPARQQDALYRWLLSTYTETKSAGVHGAIDWTLRQWGKNEDLAQQDEQRKSKTIGADCSWFWAPHRHTMAIISGPRDFWMGSRVAPVETLHFRRIPRTYAIATKETTVAQFQEFQPVPAANADPDTPVVNVSWYDAAKYCRWLSEQDNVSEDQMCFPEVDKIGPNMTLPANFLERTGYRLPTEAEWEVACRAEATTAYFWGESPSPHVRYGWSTENSRNCIHRVAELKPNAWGLFDVVGNAAEWCLDSFGPYPITANGQPSCAEPRPEATGIRVFRGGAWSTGWQGFRCAFRGSASEASRSNDIGFRIARTLAPPHE